MQYFAWKAIPLMLYMRVITIIMAFILDDKVQLCMFKHVWDLFPSPKSVIYQSFLQTTKIDNIRGSKRDILPCVVTTNFEMKLLLLLFSQKKECSVFGLIKKIKGFFFCFTKNGSVRWWKKKIKLYINSNSNVYKGEK